MDQILRLGAANKGKGGLGMQNIIPYITSVGKHGVEGGAGLRSTIQAQRGLTFSMQDVKGLKTAYADIRNSQSEFMRSFMVMYNSAGMKWQRLMAGFKVAALELGTALLPIMTQIVGGILYVVQAFSGMDPAMRRNLATVAMITAGLVFLGGIITSIAGGIASLVYMFKLLGATGAITSGGGLAAVVTVLIRIAAVAAIAAAAFYGLKEVWDEFHGNDIDGNKFQKGMRGILAFGKGVTRAMPGNPLAALWRKESDILLGQSWLTGTKKKKIVKKRADAYTDIVEKINKAVKDGMKGMGKKQIKAAQESAEAALQEVLGQTTSNPTSPAAQRAADIVTAQKDILKQASDGLMNMYKEMKTKNEALFGELFAGPVSQSAAVQWRKSFGVQMNVPEMLADMKAQLAQFSKMRSQAATLKKRGLNQDIIDTVLAMPREEAVPKLAALMGASPKDIAQFNSYMRGKKKVIVEATEIDFNTQLDKWKSFGAQAALNIAAGFESEENGVNKRMVALADRLWSSVANVMATAQVLAQNGPLPDSRTLPEPYPPNSTKAWPGAITAAQYQAQKAFAGNSPNPMHRYAGPSTPFRERQQPHQPPITNNFSVNGTFYTPEQVWDNAMRAAAYKGMRGRKN
jgi:hypothetical protein